MESNEEGATVLKSPITSPLSSPTITKRKLDDNMKIDKDVENHIDIIQNNGTVTSKRKKTKRVQRCQAESCRKKKMLIECSCKKHFCINHFTPDKHNCQHDSNFNSKDVLRKQMKDAVPSKLDKI